MSLEPRLLEALAAVQDPELRRPITELGMVGSAVLHGGTAQVTVLLTIAGCPMRSTIEADVGAALAAVPGVTHVELSLGVMSPEQRAALRESLTRRTIPFSDPASLTRVIGIASGKGGVGKSTVAVNLAVAFAHLGLKAGLLDADIYGPSAPHMMGIKDEPTFDADKRLIPLLAFGVKVMSIGFIVEDGTANIWRGPMASSALRTLMNSVWGTKDDPLDVLIVDLPPGTGDIQLTLVQRLQLDGVVIVSTPQEIALIDARRAATMFRKTGAAILGVVENMAWFADPATGVRIPIFGEGGAAREALALGVPLLGQAPIDVALRQACDDGAPLVATAPDSAAAQVFIEMAKKLR